MILSALFCFCFNDTATTEIYTLSLHDALPISDLHSQPTQPLHSSIFERLPRDRSYSVHVEDRKSTRLNSSHVSTSYAVFCLKKKTSATGPASPSPLLDIRGSDDLDHDLS